MMQEKVDQRKFWKSYSAVIDVFAGESDWCETEVLEKKLNLNQDLRGTLLLSIRVFSEWFWASFQVEPK